MKQYDELTDEELIAAIRDDDGREPEYEECLMRRYKPLVKRVAKDYFLPGGERDDLIQEGMIGLLKALKTYDAGQKASFRTFAEICVVGQMKTAIKASSRAKHSWVRDFISLHESRKEKNDEFQPPLIETVQMGKDNNPEELFLHKEYLNKIHEEIKTLLSPLENKVFYLHLQGMDYRKIAEILDKSPKAIDNALQRIKQKMTTILD